MTQTERVVLLCGDCMSLLADIPDRSVQLIIGDLSFGITKNVWDSVLPLDKLCKVHQHVCTGTVVLPTQTPYDKILGVSNLPMLRCEWIWHNTVGTRIFNSYRRPLQAHTEILVFYERPPPDEGTVYHPQCTAGTTYHRPPNSTTNYTHTKGHRTKAPPTQLACGSPCQ